MKPTETLLIGEKRNLALDVAKALAGSYTEADGHVVTADMKVSWASGHLVTLAEPEFYDPGYKRWEIQALPFIVPKFQKVPSKDRKGSTQSSERQLAILKKLLQHAGRVIHVGDPGREGQLIVDEILDRFGYTGRVDRLWLHAQTPEGIREAFKSMKDNRVWFPLSQAAEAREEIDWMIGLNGTRGYTKLWQSKGHQGVLVVGRVKSVIIALVVERELAIQRFIPVEFYPIRARFSMGGSTFEAPWERPSNAVPPAFDEKGRLVDRTFAERIVAKCTGQEATVSQVDVRKGERKPPPLLFSLGELQKVMNRIGFSPDETLDAAQELYNKYKLTTYPRTGPCQYAPLSEWARAGAIVEAVRQNFGSRFDFPGVIDTKRKSRAFDDGKLGEHFAIIPTTARVDEASLPDRERLVYREIVRRWLAQFEPDYVYDAMTIALDVAGERFVAHGKRTVDIGWRVLYPNSAALGTAQGEDTDADVSLPTVNLGDSVAVGDVWFDIDKTSPPARFTGATLLEAMEKIHLFVTDAEIKKRLKETGLGTDATRSDAMKEIVRQKFMDTVPRGKTLEYVPTPKAMAYHQVLPPHLAKPDLTAWLEDNLAAVARGEMTKQEVMQLGQDLLDRMIDDIKSGAGASRVPTPAQLPPAVVTKRGAKGKTSASAALPKSSKARPKSTANSPTRADGSGAVAATLSSAAPPVPKGAFLLGGAQRPPQSPSSKPANGPRMESNAPAPKNPFKLGG
ncbi:DNA topoisomerase [Burkholderia sp. MBR-1]|uniref:DNA topoisomerase n=1 Tax=Burkholderia sp. MBR-1 TaxID=2732364 RepID=UPI0015EFBDAC|nr:DNA topoisomerase [Burkholderia sp. MBR-1]QMI49680.1 TraE [Burkholderia sp. MBR-1]